MILIFEIRAKLAEIYQKYDLIIRTALKFILMFFVLKKTAGVIGFNTTLSGNAVITSMAAFCVVLPPSLMLLVAVAYVFLQILTASALIAVTVLMIFLVLYLFFLRFAPKEGIAVLATPVLCSFGFPFIVPLFLGMFGTILSIVPAACGVVVFYVLKAVRDNIITIEELKTKKDEILLIYMKILDNLLKNPKMYVMIAVFAVVIVTVVLVRYLQMDYSFEISLGVGTGVMILGFILGYLKYEMDFTVPKMLFGSLIAMGIVFVCLFFYRVLHYAAAEHVQFEDERYYYYVTAVPKITATSPKRGFRKVMSQRREEEAVPEDGEEEAMEAMENMLAGKKSPYSKPLTPSLAKRLRRDVAPSDEPGYGDEDEDDEVVIKGPKADQSVAAVFRSGVEKLKGFLPKKDKKPRTDLRDEEEDDEDGEAPTYFAEAPTEPDEEEYESPEKDGEEDYM
ncbi:MAG: hypothetical protein J5795_08195 [Lachnospiraceae bacterium]|nr:hypothetical protein [Lachnospiraceae bacterium]